MRDDTTIDDDALTDDQYSTHGDDRPASAAGPLSSDPPELQMTVDVAVPSEITALVSDRAVRRTARDGAVTAAAIYDLVDDYVQVWPRPLVADTGRPLVEAVADQADVTVDHSETVVFPDRQLFGASAEYRPESEVPLHVTLDPPERVLEAAGGADQLTETIRVHLADGGGDE